MNTASSIQYSVFSIQCSERTSQDPAPAIGHPAPRSPLALLPSHLVRAFTLIELLIVIAIMAILAALIIPAGATAKAAMKRNKAKAELNEVAHMIESYKITLNNYPPSTNNNSAGVAPYPPLYYELLGTRLNNGTYKTLDGSYSIAASAVSGLFGLDGFRNVSQGGGDEGTTAKDFAKGALRAGQFLEVTNGPCVILGSSIEGPVMVGGTTAGKVINPIGYNSAAPTNNPKAYDLWLDITVRGKTERIYSTLQ